MSHSCSIEREKVVSHLSLNLATGEMKDSGDRETVVESCNTPLFGADQERGICKSCWKGWEVPDNKLTERGLEQLLAAWEREAQEERRAEIEFEARS